MNQGSLLVKTTSSESGSWPQQGKCYMFDPSDKKMLPCHNFIAGFCEKGTNCLFYHPALDDLASSIISPPLPKGFGIRIRPVPEPEDDEMLDLSDQTEQETMFDHIDWMQFLAPGRLPPPIVHVSLQQDSPVRQHGRNFLEKMVEPPGYVPSCTEMASLSVKQEFRLKMGQLADELKLKEQDAAPLPTLSDVSVPFSI